MQHLKLSVALTDIPAERPISQVRAEPNEQDLVRRVARGDSQAFSDVYRQWQGPIYRFAWHMTSNVAAAEEITQETFLALMQKPAGFDSTKGSLGSYLFGIARNLLLKRMRDEVGSELLDEEGYDGPAGGPDPWAALTRQQLIDTVRAAVISLPLPYREAVALCDLEELSYEAAALALDCPVGTVRSRLSRGRLLLGMKLREFARTEV